jgi:hypothetical protein
MGPKRTLYSPSELGYASSQSVGAGWRGPEGDESPYRPSVTLSRRTRRKSDVFVHPVRRQNEKTEANVHRSGQHHSRAGVIVRQPGRARSMPSKPCSDCDNTTSACRKPCVRSGATAEPQKSSVVQPVVIQETRLHRYSRMAGSARRAGTTAPGPAAVRLTPCSSELDVSSVRRSPGTTNPGFLSTSLVGCLATSHCGWARTMESTVRLGVGGTTRVVAPWSPGGWRAADPSSRLHPGGLRVAGPSSRMHPGGEVPAVGPRHSG